MKMIDACDAAYRNGYEKGKADARKELTEWANRGIAEYETADGLYSEDEETRNRAAAQVAVLQAVKAHIKEATKDEDND